MNLATGLIKAGVWQTEVGELAKSRLWVRFMETSEHHPGRGYITTVVKDVFN